MAKKTNLDKKIFVAQTNQQKFLPLRIILINIQITKLNYKLYKEFY